MPIPVTLQNVITQLGTKFNPQNERPEYKAELADWNLYIDLFELDQKKLRALVERHFGDESKEMLTMRQQLAAVFNYVPTLIRMVVNYVHWEQPTIEVGDDTALKAFVDNCDGAGTPLADFTRKITCPLSLVFGFMDTLVQNPAVEPGTIISQEDVQSANLSPQIFSIRPIERIDWSTKPNHEYNWIRFIDYRSENSNPFRNGEGQSVEGTISYLTISGSVQQVSDLAKTNNETIGGGGFWIRSWKAAVDGDGKIIEPDLSGNVNQANQKWVHDGGWSSISSAPVCTLYFSKSSDPKTRHKGLSKIAVVAILTRKIIQMLSWTDEDVLANLALFVFPGEPPKDKDGKQIDVVLSPFKIMWTGKGVNVQAQILQGETSMIEVKLKIIDSYIREILRLAYIIGASGEAETVTSGVQGVVSRNELFMELSELAESLDSYTMKILQLVKAHADNKDVSDDTLPDTVNVDYYKGPYLIDPLETTIANSLKLIEVFGVVSPEMCKQVYRQLALTALENENDERDTVLEEIDSHFEDLQATMEADRQAVVDSLASTGGGPAVPPVAPVAAPATVSTAVPALPVAKT